MNSEQFDILLNKLEKLKKDREREEVAVPLRIEPDRSHSKSKRHAPPQGSAGRYPHDITKYEVTETLGAGTFGRVKQVIAPNREVLALKQISKSHIMNLKQVEHIKL